MAEARVLWVVLVVVLLIAHDLPRLGGGGRAEGGLYQGERQELQQLQDGFLKGQSGYYDNIINLETCTYTRYYRD